MKLQAFRNDKASILSHRFIIPPFNFFLAREDSADWKALKRQWLALGIQSELGRGESLSWGDGSDKDIDNYRHLEKKRNRNLKPGGGGNNNSAWGHVAGKGLTARYKKKIDSSPGGSAMPAMDYSKGQRGRGDGKPITNDEDATGQTGTSIFDPVVCQTYYRWFSGRNATILDPFAGGSVRGIVASVMGRDYVGIDLRPEQVEANRIQAQRICGNEYKQPTWIAGDSLHVKKHIRENRPDLFEEGFDSIFTCPPYFDLEQYSDDECDLSTMDWNEFSDTYADIIYRSCKLLKNDRFASIVVGDIRSKKGKYRKFPELTIECFEDAGLELYNRAVLVTSVGTLSMRVQKQFMKSRKLGNTTQFIYTFVKGDELKATAACEPFAL